MKSLPLTSPHYRYVLQGFTHWLDTLGYAEYTVYEMPNKVREILHYMEQQGLTEVKQIDNKHIKGYYNKIKQRSNTRRGGGLSNASLNKHQQAIQKFSDYIRQTGRHTLPKLYIASEETDHEIKDILTQEEIQQLYKAVEIYPEQQKNTAAWMYEALALRDKAMLSVLYGCGLRRNEAVGLDIDDIHAQKKYIYVKKGKDNKERIVPINNTGLIHLQNYLYESRPRFLRSEKEEALLVSQRGKRINGQTLLLRLKILIQRVENTELQQKQIGLHTLRHSIATHLLQNGMKLEAISKFLGHSSLESTQIYTHLVEKEAELSGKNIL